MLKRKGMEGVLKRKGDGGGVKDSWRRRLKKI